MSKLPDKLFAPKERDIERACTELIGHDGWIPFVTDPPQLRGLGVSEPGVPDRQYRRYLYTGPPTPHWFSGWNREHSELLWIEWKRKGGKAGEHQIRWHERERARGGLVWLAGVDFPASYDGFLAHYRASGLNRRPI